MDVEFIFFVFTGFRCMNSLFKMQISSAECNIFGPASLLKVQLIPEMCRHQSFFAALMIPLVRTYGDFCPWFETNTGFGYALSNRPLLIHLLVSIILLRLGSSFDLTKSSDHLSLRRLQVFHE